MIKPHTVKQWIHTPIDDEVAFNDAVKTVCDIYHHAIDLNKTGVHVISCNKQGINRGQTTFNLLFLLCDKIWPIPLFFWAEQTFYVDFAIAHCNQL